MENLWDVQEKALHSGPTLPSSKQDLGEKVIHRMEKNLDISEANAPLNACVKLIPINIP